VTSLVGAVKTLSDPNKTGLQKFAAVLDVAGGAAGLIPGLGTGVQAAISGVTTAVSAGADLLSTPAKGQQGWVNAGSPSSTRPVSLLDDGFDGKLP
jgi:6-phosphogluconate dehydrogenase (decarboxylating)